MTNTAAVSQPSIAAGEAIADRSRNGGRKDAAAGEAGGFPRLLSKIAGNRGRADGSASSGQETGGGDGSRSTVAGWLRANPEVLGDDTRVGDLEMLTGEPTATPSSSDATVSMALGIATDAGALPYVLGASGALSAANNMAAIVTRVANGVGSEAEVAPVQASVVADADGEAAFSDEIMLAGLARAVNPTGERPAVDAMHETTVPLTVLRRETHLAPVHALAAADAGAKLVAELVAGGNRVTRTDVPLDADMTADAELLASGDAVEAGANTQPADPRVAAAAARGGQLGGDLQRAGSLLAGPQAAADASSSAGNGVTGSELAPPVVRDALVNASVAAGVGQQIAERVAAEANTLTAQAGRPEAAATAAKQPFGSPVKVLYIQLQPADLGIVTIRMSVKDQTLQLDLEAGRGETAQIIQRDRDTLSTLLRSAGYLIDGVDVRVADPSSANAQAGNTQASMQMQGGGQSGASQADARSSGARPQDERRGNTSGNERNGENEQAGTAARRGDIYV